MLSILDEFERYVNMTGGAYDAWHSGVTSDVEKSLAKHGVESGDLHFHVKADSPGQARIIVRFLVQKGMSDEPGNFDQEALFVYIYKKSGHTKP
jgi:hypothetical protein